MGAKYKGIIVTDHALERMRERNVSQEMVWVALSKPDRSRYADNRQKFIYNKTFGQEMVEVVASQNEKKEWVVVSVWSRPLSQLSYTSKQYYARNRLVDKLLDWVEGRFIKRKK